MKIRLGVLSVFLIGFGIFVMAGPRDELWKAVEQAESKGLPKTAIEKLEPIIAGALKDKNYDEAIKAIAKKVALSTPKIDERIAQLKAEIEKAPAEMKPAMEAILANWYWGYFQQNRWRFLQRTQTQAPPGEDFTTWDLATIIAEIDQQFQKALASADRLKKIPIAEYEELLIQGTAPDEYRPTLYDFLVFEAIDFYSAGEQGLARPVDAFEPEASSPLLDSAEKFLAWNPESTDENSPTLRAVRLYQEVMKFHQNDEDKSAFLDADLHRLNFGHNAAVGEEKDERYVARLKQFAQKNANHEISTRAIAEWAEVVHQQGDWVEARKIALTGVERNAESLGGRRCANLIAQIEAPSSQITTERVWNKPLPTIDVTYRNLTEIYFRVVPFDLEKFVRSDRWRPEYLTGALQEQLLRADPVLAWSRKLPSTDDYKLRTEELPAPEDLKPGSYYLITSHNEQFDSTDNQIHMTEFWVSDLALVIRVRNGEGVLGGFVLNAITGEPISGASVRGWRRGERNQVLNMRAVKTDKNGMFRFNGQDRNRVVLLATHGEHSLSTNNSLYTNQYDSNPRPHEQTVFFTDRAIYRPGQAVQFKGICIRVDQAGNNYEVLKNRDVTIALNDVNGKEVELVKLKTNDYGSFSGSMTAPQDRLTGQMTLRVKEGPSGQSAFRVEEYKRPKFRVEIEPPEQPPRLGEDVQITGKATAYTGVPIDGAQVRWRVVREVQYPMWWYWCCWWMPPHPGEPQEIAHGSGLTKTDGSFELAFTAKPDLSVPKESEPTFAYTIYADITDTTGETRSAERQVRVGYAALKAEMTAAEWQSEDNPVELTLKTTSLDGEGEPAQGTLKIFSLRQPEKVARPPLSSYRPYYARNAEPGDKLEVDPANPNSWPEDELAFETDFQTGDGGSAKVSAKLAAGMYRAKLETQDRFGRKVTAVLPLEVLDPDANDMNLKIPNLVEAPKWSLEPGEEFVAVWGSGYDSARAYVEIEHQGEILQSYWTEPGVTQAMVKQKVDESMRGGFQFRVTMVRENRAYIESRRVDVPWSNKKLTVKWERFVSKLKPGEPETWTAVITGSDAQKAAAEMVAALYDASLDAYQPHDWPSMFHVFRQDHSRLGSQFENEVKHLQHIAGQWNIGHQDVTLTYRHFPPEILQMIHPYFYRQRGWEADVPLGMPAPTSAPPAKDAQRSMAFPGELAANGIAMEGAAGGEENQTAAPEPQPNLAEVSARKNLNETAFFFPHLSTGEDGSVRIEFTMPEALTEWKFLGFAHDQNLRSGLLTDTVVTSKDLMVQPNPPRFVREGDEIEFTVKISNQSPDRQTGQVRLTFSEVASGDPVDKRLGNANTDRMFDVPAGESRTISWKLSIPDSLSFLTYKAVGSTGRLSDGEEGYLPVLSRRVLVTESLTLPIRGIDTKEFEFERLLNSGKSDSLEHKLLTVEMVSNPSWYAVMALPYLMEYPHQCTEQTFNRLYANAVARHIAGSDPKIRRVFDAWKTAGGETLDSPLEKNEDIKQLLLEETPWVREAEEESQARRNVGILFDKNRLDREVNRIVAKLAEQQYEDGRWPWFPGGRPNDYITLYITTGFGRMRHLGIQVDMAPAIQSLDRLDAWVTEIYNNIRASERNKNHLTPLIAFYIYGRSFFLNDQAIAQEHKTAVDYWLGQAKKYWLPLGHRQSQGHLAIGLARFGDLETAHGIVKSLKERATVDEELGMYWKDTERSWWWYRAPIETQALMIEAFDEVAQDADAVEECKVWLLKQKQTQNWPSTKSTADAVYALLLRGTDLLASDDLVKVTLGEKTIKPQNVEAGTGYYQERFTGNEIEPGFGNITVKKTDEGVAWGSINWQYLEDMKKVTAYEGTPLKLTKELYIKEFTDDGPALKKVTGPVEVGDELVVRVVLRTDRAMEYVHLKDYRGSGTEPVNVLSTYRFQDGLAYYESTRDAATHFFIDYLPKGTYVFEYSVRVQLKGEYQTGFASIQCMYAPEFNSHSESLQLTVK